jgi:hypothetical protein
MKKNLRIAIQRDKTPLQGKIEPITIEERGIPVKITMEEIAELHAEQNEEEMIDGKPCICVSSSFRAAQLAFSKLWRENEEIPKREDIKIISTLPTEGSQQTFKYILGIEPVSKSNARGEFELALPAGTDKKNLMQDNYVFTFIRKSTNASFQVQVKLEVFPDGFFVQRRIVEHGIPREATEKRKIFEKREREVRDKFLAFSEEELFISEMDE